MEVPLGMLITSAKYISETKAEIFGFWYYSEIYVPSTTQEKKSFFHDLMTGRCIQLNIVGSCQQILSLLRNTDAFSQYDEKSVNQFNIISKALEQHIGIDISFENIVSPAGTAYSLDTLCEFDETMESLQMKINTRRDKIELHISEKWIAERYF